jgi:hypothetical protein
MRPWVPWDADEAEEEELNVVRDMVPDAMRPALLRWLYQQLESAYGYTNADLLNQIQSALRIRLSPGSDARIETDELVAAIEREGVKFTLRVVDFLLSGYEVAYDGRTPGVVQELRWHLDTSMSAVTISVDNEKHRLSRRLPEGVEEAAQTAIDAAPRIAGSHLAKAMIECQSLEPDTSAVMTDAIRAVESAGGAVVIPRDKAPRLSKIVAALKDKPDWTLVLQQRDDGEPNHRAVLIGMLETLAFAQRDRHSGTAPSLAEAQGHVLLAANLVGWFATGIIHMGDDD